MTLSRGRGRRMPSRPGGQVSGSLARLPLRKRRRSARWAAAGLFGGSLLAAVGVLHSPLTAAKRLILLGARHETALEIRRATGITRQTPLADISVAAVEARLDQLPWVARAEVAVVWPDQVRVEIAERVPVACIKLGKARFALVDRTGRVLEIRTARPRGLVALSYRGGVVLGKWIGPLGQAEAHIAAMLPRPLAGDARLIEALGPEWRIVLARGSVILGPPGSLALELEAAAAVVSHEKLAPEEVVDVRVPSLVTLTEQRTKA
jgi:cell division septal protein FtsQ